MKYLDKIFNIQLLIGVGCAGVDWHGGRLNGSSWKNVFYSERKFPPRIQFALRVTHQEGQEHDVEAGGDVEVANKI